MNRPIHNNLDTAFINLSALIKYLRRRQFVGGIRVELTGYEADITLTADNQLRVREYDRIAGRIAEGDEALQRLLIRAREPGGNIDVYQEAEEPAASPSEEPAKPVSSQEKSAPTIQIIPPETEKVAPAIEEKSPHVEVEPIAAGFIAKPVTRNGNSAKSKAETPIVEENLPKKINNLPPLPFELTNRCEDKAKSPTLAPQDWQTLLNITAELLNTIDKTLAEANLEFAAAFEKARSEIANDYPFLSPSANIFNYKDGKIIIREQVNTKLFAASINESLKRILEKLGKNPKFLNIYLTTVQKIILLIEKRRPLYDKFSITPQLARTIGV